MSEVLANQTECDAPFAIVAAGMYKKARTAHGDLELGMIEYRDRLCALTCKITGNTKPSEAEATLLPTLHTSDLYLSTACALSRNAAWRRFDIQYGPCTRQLVAHACSTRYHGTYEPLVSRELWEQVQAVLGGRHAKRPKKRTHNFAFSGIVTCGHCSCSMVGEMKKGRYVYYHCTGHKGKCSEPYTREEVLERNFSRILEGLSFSREALEWVTTALRDSHKDQKQFHEDALAGLQREHRRLQDRIDAMYIDKLDGRIDNEFFGRKAGEFRAEQWRIGREMDAHRVAYQSYIEQGIKLLEFARQARTQFENQPATEKRKLLDFVLSNCRWKDGKLEAEYRQPFDLIASAALADRQLKSGGGGGNGDFNGWRRDRDSNPG